MVAAGQTDIAFGYQPQLHLHHAAGLALVRVGTLIDSPLYCVMVAADGPVTTLSDLRGKRIVYSVPGIEEALLHIMLRDAGIEPSKVAMPSPARCGEARGPASRTGWKTHLRQNM